MMQTPGSPVAGGSSAGRKTSKRIVLVCHGVSESDLEVCSRQWTNDSILPINRHIRFRDSHICDIKKVSSKSV